ncbi:MAG: hypothetical protein OXC11_11060 [Rhodospirillales bacterium]|nr:hypothetical protein [Rhodospirillales bacterium]
MTDNRAPYYLHGSPPYDIRHRDRPGRPVLIIPSWVQSIEEVQALVGLLNKGTAFEDLLQTLVQVNDRLEHGRAPLSKGALTHGLVKAALNRYGRISDG